MYLFEFTEINEVSPDSLEGSFTPDLVTSKTWLATLLSKGLKGKNVGTIYALGSWYGNIGIFLQQHNIKFDRLVLVEPNEKSLLASKKLLQPLNDEGKLVLLSVPAEDVVYEKPGIVINTSCNETGPEFLQNVPKGMLVVLQSRNNVRNVQTDTKTLDDLLNQFPLGKVYYKGDKHLSDPEVSYDRFMVIGSAKGELNEGLKNKVAALATAAGLLGGPIAGNIMPSDMPQGYAAKHQLPKPQRPLTKIENYLAKTGKQAGMAGHEIAQLLAQASHETGNFMAMEEQGDKKYLLHNYWNNVPMRKALGNKHPSDAIRYKGRGFIQLTGRGNYERMGKLLKIDLLNHPELAKRPDIASKIAVQYFKDRIEPSVQDFNNTQAVTKKINPHDKPESVKDRDDKFQQYKNLLGMN